MIKDKKASTSATATGDDNLWGKHEFAPPYLCQTQGSRKTCCFPEYSTETLPQLFSEDEDDLFWRFPTTCLYSYFSSPAIQKQALLILRALFSLPCRSWFDIYNNLNYQHKFELVGRFLNALMVVQEGRTLLEIVGIINLTLDQVGAWEIKNRLSQRKSLVHARLRTRRMFARA
ncbi:hypothetical protein PtB15_7B449 [Puccinia triticina]|nr:hypothetical protein PtB15_7B449 [Puccinia triticina]